MQSDQIKIASEPGKLIFRSISDAVEIPSETDATASATVKFSTLKKIFGVLPDSEFGIKFSDCSGDEKNRAICGNKIDANDADYLKIVCGNCEYRLVSRERDEGATRSEKSAIERAAKLAEKTEVVL